MSLDKLKDTARKFEQKEEWRKAIEVYLKAIQQVESGKDATPDLSLYNRVGDLYLKIGDTASAVRHYERAVDLYADQGFFNNAIALCGKILRVNPGRTLTYLRLAQLHARKNVVIEAKRNLLEYLERMHGQGQLDEAFAALKAFADQFSASQDIRLMLIELLRAASRTEEAREQLEKLSAELEARTERPAPPAAETESAPVHTETAPTLPRRGGDLVFLDTGFGVPPASGDADLGRTGERRAIAPEGLELTEPLQLEPAPLRLVDEDPSVAAAHEEEITVLPVEGIEVTAPALVSAEGEVGGFEATVFDPSAIGLEAEAPQALDDMLLEGTADDEIVASGVVIEYDAGEPLQLTGRAEGDGATDSSHNDSALEMLEPEPASPPELDLSDESAQGLATTEGDVGSAGAGNAGPDGLVFLEAPLSDERVSVEVGNGDFAPPAAGAAVEHRAGTEDLDALQQAVVDRPDDPGAHAALAAALLRSGERAQALHELQIAVQGYETLEAWDSASDAAEQVLLLEPDEMRHYQKLVELAFRSGRRSRLIEAYLRLADALLRWGELEKAHAVYNRVLDHDPTNARAQAGLVAVEPPEEMPPLRPAAPAVPQRGMAAEPPAPEPAASEAQAAEPATAGADFVDLGSLVLDERAAPRDTRMRVEGRQPIEDEQRAFEETLAEFKRGIEQNLAADDYEAHYDLGVAFKEMGLLDEAIAEFQKALRAPEGRLRTSEALGMAFFDKGQFGIAETVLRRAVDGLEAPDDAKIGLLYWLGRSAEAQGKVADALASYERALAVDIRFMDTTDRIHRLSAGRQ
jgi:tetratricopeptide (TPR) repeat protein